MILMQLRDSKTRNYQEISFQRISIRFYLISLRPTRVGLRTKYNKQQIFP